MSLDTNKIIFLPKTSPYKQSHAKMCNVVKTNVSVTTREICNSYNFSHNHMHINT